MKTDLLTEEVLNAKAKKHILIVLFAGFLIFVLTCVAGTNSDSLTLSSGENGLYMIRPDADEPSGHISLEAEIETEDGKLKKNFDVTINSFSEGGTENSNNSGDSETGSNAGGTDKMSKEELISYEMKSITGSLNDDTSLHKVTLPNSLSTGEKITWKQRRKNNLIPIVFAVAVLCVILYVNRFTPLKKQIQAQQDSITRQLPEFINRLVLLLNAGLVLNSAFEKAVDESNTLRGTENDYFYEKMREIRGAVRETNGSMDRSFREFAKSRRTAGGDTAQELMRISNIISDNISKGVELTDKLTSESEMLWLNRKRNCEERGRLAETKLTLPLTVFLLVLIVITVSPALLEL